MKALAPHLKKVLACLLSYALVLSTSSQGRAFSQTAPTQTAVPSSYTGQGTPLTTGEIDSLVSPIALYPDALVAQVLSAATFPDQLAVANYWVQQHKDLSGNALMQAVNKESWDPSVKALTQFPTVLNNLASNLTWTSQLGEAYHNQHSDVMSAVQVLRKQAQDAGNLKTTPQQTVKTESQSGQQVIVIQPSNPQVVYIPSYNPAVIYGTAYNPPGYSTADLVTTGLLSFGAGMAVGAMMSGGCCGWGYSSWNCNWYGGGVYYHGGAYYGNSAWHGGYYGGYGNNYHSNYNNGYQHVGNNNYNRANYSHNTNVSGNTVNVNRGSSAADSFNKSSFANSDAARGFGSADSHSGSSAFSGWGGHSDSGFGGSGWGGHSDSGFGGGGWGSRSASSRGWASGGGGGGWGGGGFRGGGGGGFRR